MGWPANEMTGHWGEVLATRPEGFEGWFGEGLGVTKGFQGERGRVEVDGGRADSILTATGRIDRDSGEEVFSSLMNDAHGAILIWDR